MYFFLIPLAFGFGCNLASAFTTAFSRRWGEKRGSIISAVLRDVLGIPVWGFGCVLAIRVSSPALFVSTIGAKTAGTLLITAGAVMILVAIASIRRRAAAPSVQDTLVRSGIYAYVRHPIHTGTALEFLGVFLITPTLPVALACTLGVLWVLAQTRVEEVDLMQRLPDYDDYRKAVPCFLPRFPLK